MRKSRLGKVLIILMTISLMLVSCGVKEWGEEVAAPKDLPIATIKVKDYGTILAELYPQYAPNTVNNFISLANNGFYDGITFHRIVKDFVIQEGSLREMDISIIHLNTMRVYYLWLEQKIRIVEVVSSL